MPVSVLHSVPDLVREQQGVVGTDPVLQQAGIAQLDILVKTFGSDS